MLFTCRKSWQSVFRVAFHFTYCMAVLFETADTQLWNIWAVIDAIISAIDEKKRKTKRRQSEKEKARKRSIDRERKTKREIERERMQRKTTKDKQKRKRR